MIRVLEVVATLKRAGAETLVTSLVTGLDRSRFEPAVCALYDPSENDLEPAVRAAGIRVWRLGKKRGFDVRVYTRLRRVLREFRPDIIHTHSYVMRYTLPVARCAAVHTVHNLASREVEGLGRMVHRAGYRTGVVPVAVAEEVARSFEAVYGFHPAVIPNGIDVRRFSKPEVRSAWRAANGFRDEDTLIVSVARLEPQKNPELLIAALPDGFHLLLAGDGSLRSRLEGRPRVHLLGVRSDLPELLSSCDAFALASDWEGHPIALMEAMAAGLPVVATAVGGVPEIVGNAGILVAAGDAAGLRRGLETVVRERVTYTEAARRRADAFDVQRTISAYSELFQRVAR